MSKGKSKNNKEQNKKYKNNVSQEKIIGIQAEAYYRALKRIEDEKAKADEIKSKKKYKWYETVLLVLNVLFWPWKINKKFSVINHRIYDSILVLVVSGALKVGGGLIWLSGIFSIMYDIYQMITLGIIVKTINVSPIVIFSLFLGGIFVMAGEEFGKETDSNKIYAYSASIIALISCVVGIIAIIGI